MSFIKELKKKEEVRSHLQVSKYQNQAVAMELITHILSANPQTSLSQEFDEVKYIFTEYKDRLNGDNEDFSIDIDTLYSKYNITKGAEFLDNILSKVEALEYDLTNNIPFSLKIAVAGGYSAGKSSFLNAFTNIGTILPTGIEPVSMVNTFISCTPNAEGITVLGENIKNDLIALDTEVLSCIQHSSNSKVYIASVLNKLILDIPAHKKFLEGVTFIDTPGYNNSISVNTENNKTDKDTAVESFESADVIFWCIDIECGCITNNDLEILKKVKDKPILIIFTKSDKKPKDEVKLIINKAREDYIKYIGNEPLDVVAYSSREDEDSFIKHKNFQTLFDDIHSLTGKADCWSFYEKKLNDYGDEIGRHLDEAIERVDKDRRKIVDTRFEISDNLDKEIKDNLKKIEICDDLFSIYPQLIDLYANLKSDLYPKILENIRNSYSREMEWSEKSGFFSTTDYLIEASKESLDEIDELLTILDNKLNKEININDVELSTAHNQYFYNIIKEYLEGIIDNIERQKQTHNNEYNDIRKFVNHLKREKDTLNDFIKLLTLKIATIKDSCNKKIAERRENMKKLAETKPTHTIFEAIEEDDMMKFLESFSKGVDLHECNDEGYNVITFIAKNGNNEMIKFLRDRDVSFALKDKNGLNALEVAVQEHFQDICKIIMEYDTELISSSNKLVELSKQNTFTEWISNQIK